MKKIILLFLLIPIYVFGYTIDPKCTQNEKLELRKTVSKFNYALEKYKEGDTVNYKINILNMTNDVVISYLDKKYSLNNNVIDKIIPGTIVSLKLDANPNGICDGYSISNKIIQIPYYNKYKDHELCKDYQEYFLCKEDVNTKVSEEEFKRQINEYIKEKNKVVEDEENPEPQKESPTIYEKIMDFIYNNYIYILYGIIVVSSLGILIIQIKKHNSDDIL